MEKIKILFIKEQTLTLLEGGRSPHLRTDNNRRAAFTLAEVLITLGIIGVVAALTLPMFLENVNERVKARRIENIKQKLSKVTDKMASLDKLQGHDSTYDFVIEMKNHMNIAKICKDHVEDCWPTSEITLRKHAPADKSNTYLISKITEPENLRLRTEFINWAEPVGIITADGTSMIISYNKDCPITSDTGLIFDQASSTSNSLSCIAGIFDWNGKSRPNFMGDDVQSLGAASVEGSCSAEVKMNDGTYICTAGSVHVPTPLTLEECQKNKAKLQLSSCCSNFVNGQCNTGYDYLSGAVAECGGIENMFSSAELAKIASYIYGDTIETEQEKSWSTSNRSYNDKRALELGLPKPGYYILPNDNYSASIMVSRGFNEYNTLYRRAQRTSPYPVLCKGD